MELTHMELNRFVTLQTVVEEGTFARAAHKLCCTQSTITFHIRQLEQELSVQIFEKIGRRMVLSEAGRAMLPLVRNLTQAVDAIRSAVQPGALGGDLHLAVGETLLAFRIPSILARFRAIAPNVRLFLSALNCYEIRDRLVAGKVDLGLFYSDASDPVLDMHTLGSFPMALVASPLLGEVDFMRHNQRLPVSLVINEAQCIYRLTLEQVLHQRNIILENVIELWSIESIKKCVEGNLGVTYLPRFCVEQELRTGILQELRLHPKPEVLTAVCAHHTKKSLGPAARLFLDLLRDGI